GGLERGEPDGALADHQRPQAPRADVPEARHRLLPAPRRFQPNRVVAPDIRVHALESVGPQFLKDGGANPAIDPPAAQRAACVAVVEVGFPGPQNEIHVALRDVRAPGGEPAAVNDLAAVIDPDDAAVLAPKPLAQGLRRPGAVISCHQPVDLVWRGPGAGN